MTPTVATACLPFSASPGLIVVHPMDLLVHRGISRMQLVQVSEIVHIAQLDIPIHTTLHFSDAANCGDYVDCYNCATQEQCAWCASENVCYSLSEAFSKDCRGLIFEPPCPSNYIPGLGPLCMCPTQPYYHAHHFTLTDNVIVGNLVVKADPTFGGGALNITGECCLLSNFACRVVTPTSLQVRAYRQKERESTTSCQ